MKTQPSSVLRDSSLGGFDDMEPIPADWTDRLLEWLEVAEAGCENRARCACEDIALIRERSVPAMAQNRFVQLVQKHAEMSYSEAKDYYANYLSDVRAEQHRDRMDELFSEAEKACSAFSPDLPYAEFQNVAKRFNRATDEIHKLMEYIREPLR